MQVAREAGASLESLQAQAMQRFNSLSAQRTTEGLPLFALEHGFHKEQLNQIFAGLRRQITFGQELSKVWLLWVIYATELGYNFDGEEYWQSFERQTPQWKSEGNRRNLLRGFFERFAKTFGGTVPTGPWANQFSIIAWPITHAVLPRDLQSQMARTLFDWRHEVGEAAHQPARVLGSLVARYAEFPSSRFRNFLEQEELTGYIAKALLLPDSLGTQTPLTPQIQTRIVGDLEASHQAKSWLSEARKVAQQVQIRLLARRSAEVMRAQSPGAVGPREVSDAASVSPKIVLQERPEGGWETFIEVPSFASWARANPTLDAFLRTTRCKVAGTEDIWRAKRWLLFGAQRCRLLEWPRHASWLRFEAWQEGTVREIEDACRVQARPLLFRLDEHRVAQQAKWRTVRPGSSYLVLHSAELEACAHLSPVNVETRGIYAYLLQVPTTSTEESGRCLGQLGLAVSRQLKVWPAGLPPIGYSGEDSLEWCTSKPLTLGIEHDDACKEFQLQIDGGCATFPTGGRRVSFVGLGRLSPGKHQISIAATYLGGDGKAQLRKEATQRTFAVHARPQAQGLASRLHAPVLVVASDPHESTLDAMMSGIAVCTVHGPRGSAVDFHLELLDASGSTLHKEKLGTLQVPVAREQWQSLVASRDTAGGVNEAQFRASAGRLVVDGGDLGTIGIALRHAQLPVRWHVKRDNKRFRLMVVDDTDHSVAVQGYRATFQQPSKTDESWSCIESVDVNDVGGLYVVHVNRHRSCIVVHSPPAKMSLGDWAHSCPKLAPHLKCAQEVSELLIWIRDWHSARPVGPLSEHRKREVLRELHRQLFASMCGVGWADLEVGYKKGADVSRSTAVLESELWPGGKVSFAIGLSRHALEIVSSSLVETCENFLQHVGPYSVCGDTELCEQALRLAISPHTFVEWAGTSVCDLLDRLVDRRTLLRAARLVALLNGERGELAAENW